LRVPLETYLNGSTGKVFSLVASVPFSPIDIDLSLLARGEWNAFCDRFRIWHVPSVDGQNGKPASYVMVRKFDPEQGVLMFAHIVMNLDPFGAGSEPPPTFMVGILCNDEVKARSVLGAMLEVPPIFHKRSEITLVERKWRTDPETIARFAANVFAATSSAMPGDKVYRLKLEPPSDFMAKINGALDSWWADKNQQGA
jgi:hypothetical protein